MTNGSAQEWNKSTQWELDYFAEIDEIQKAQAARTQAILDGTEPFEWIITGLDGTEWPSEAIFPIQQEKGGAPGVGFE